MTVSVFGINVLLQASCSSIILPIAPRVLKCAPGTVRDAWDRTKMTPSPVKYSLPILAGVFWDGWNSPKGSVERVWLHNCHIALFKSARSQPSCQCLNQSFASPCIWDTLVCLQSLFQVVRQGTSSGIRNHTSRKGCERQAFAPGFSHQARALRGEDYFWHNKGIIWRNKLLMYVLAIF